MKLDNPQPSCSYLTYWTWPPSAIFDFRGKHIWTNLHVAGPHCLRTHETLVKISTSAATIFPKTEFEKNTPWQQNSISGFEIDAFTRSGTNVCVIVHNFMEIGQSATE